MYKADYHMHTSFSIDSEEKMESQIKGAIEKGFDEICITDHFEKEPIDGKMQLSMDILEYMKAVKSYQQLYKDRIKIKLGVEVGYEARFIKEISENMQPEDFDFIICSTHKCCDGPDLYYGDFFLDKTQDEAYQVYFEQVLMAVKDYTHFDVYGHIDYVNRYGHYQDRILDISKYKDVIYEILKVILDKGKGLEVNTSGIRYGLGHFNPQIPLLKMYLDMGGEIITIGSDAHNVQHVGYLWDEAANMLKSIGFKYFTTFEKRKPVFHKL